MLYFMLYFKYITYVMILDIRDWRYMMRPSADLVYIWNKQRSKLDNDKHDDDNKT